jgi:hypothetical protein
MSRVPLMTERQLLARCTRAGMVAARTEWCAMEGDSFSGTGQERSIGKALAARILQQRENAFTPFPEQA